MDQRDYTNGYALRFSRLWIKEIILMVMPYVALGCGSKKFYLIVMSYVALGLWMKEILLNGYVLCCSRFEDERNVT